jgi:hypothetical protein
MTRVGKIARLPRAVRDELNRRLDNGEQGKRLLVWLNGLAEVKLVMDREFEGRPISKGSLHEWKNGGFADWRIQQETVAVAKEFMAGGIEFGTVSDEVVRNIEAAAMAHYAAALHRSNSDPKEDPRERFERMRKSLLDVVRLRRCEHARQEMEIRREWLELERRRIQRQKMPESTELPANCNEIQPMTEEEKTELLRELLLPKEEGGAPQ